MRQQQLQLRYYNSSNSSSNNVPSSSSSEFRTTKPFFSRLLGLAPSSLALPPHSSVHLAGDGVGAIDRTIVVETIKDDFQRSYFVTGALTFDAYEEDCEFADPAGSFKGLGRFKRTARILDLLLKNQV